jgi:serum/glucocorticoid-regulated kinase 2
MNPDQKISIEDFEYIKVIGRGSFGKVYLVRKLDTQMVYAMKILKKGQLIKMNLLTKTMAERKILEECENPYIVKLHFAF